MTLPTQIHKGASASIYQFKLKEESKQQYLHPPRFVPNSTYVQNIFLMNSATVRDNYTNLICSKLLVVFVKIHIIKTRTCA